MIGLNADGDMVDMKVCSVCKNVVLFKNGKCSKCGNVGSHPTPDILPVEQKTTKSNEGVDLDQLQQETQKLLALLKDRQSDLMTWNDFFRERLTNLHKLIAQALGK